MYCDLKSYGQTFVRLNWFIITAEPLETEHQLCKDLVMTYGRWTFTRIKQQGSLPRKFQTHLHKKYVRAEIENH